MDKPKTFWDTFESPYQMGDQRHRLYVLDQLNDLGIKNILDVGCGTGPVYDIIQRHEYPFFYMGVDYSPAMIEIAEREFPEAKWEVQDARDLKELTNSWNCVLLLHCLDHLNDYEAAIAEAARVSNKYVAIVLWRPFVTGSENRLNDRNMYGKQEGENPWEDTYLHEYSEERLQETFKKNNLKVIHVNNGAQVNDPGKYNWVCILQKMSL